MASTRLELQRLGMVLHADSYEPTTTSITTTNSKVAFLLHGFPDTTETWRYLVPDLCAKGFHVVVPVMRGYEASSALHTVEGSKLSYRRSYLITDLVEDLAAWMDLVEENMINANKWKKGDDGEKNKFCLVGHDWGSALVTCTTITYPSRVSHLINMSVPHTKYFLPMYLRFPKQIINSWYMLFFCTVYLPEYYIRKSTEFIVNLWKSWGPLSFEKQLKKDAVSTANVLKSDRRVTEATIGYYRSIFNVFNVTCLKAWQSFMTAPPIKKDILCLSMIGRKDGCIDADAFVWCTSSSKCYEGWGTPSHKLEVVEDVGHFLHLEKPKEINALIVDWLAQ